MGGDTETNTGQPICNVRSVPPDMVTLTEDALPLVGIDDAWILECLITGHRDDDKCPTIHSEDAEELLHGPAIVGHVLEHVAADEDVERPVREIEIGHIQSQVDVLSFEICGSIPGPQTPAEERFETVLRREVQDTLLPPIEEVGFIVQEEPNEPMPLERSTVDALGLASGGISMGTEPSG